MCGSTAPCSFLPSLGARLGPVLFLAATTVIKKVARPILLNLNAEGRRQGVKNVKSRRSFFFPSRCHHPEWGWDPAATPSSDCGGK